MLTKAGDVVFAAGQKYKLTRPMVWDQDRKCWYAPGFKWIKSKQKFSSNALLHTVGPHYEIVEE